VCVCVCVCVCYIISQTQHHPVSTNSDALALLQVRVIAA